MEGKNYFAFKVGSWWLYEEENSGLQDSIFVKTYWSDENTFAFDVRLESAMDGYGYHFFPQYINHSLCSQTEESEYKCLYIKRSKSKTGDFLGEANCFFINHLVNDFIYSANNTNIDNRLTCSSITDVYTLNGTDYGRTVVFHENNSVNEGKQETNHYYARGVGLIRKELIDSNQVWNLINYHIVE
jgi:hypothetical protein